MTPVYLPPAPHGHAYYEASQLAAFTLYAGLLLAQGWQRGYAWRHWLPLVAAATLALMLGCQLIFLPPGQWLDWLRGDPAVAHALAAGPRSVLGGALASLLAVLALRRALGFRDWGVLDAFAGPLCWALVAQCIGCVLVGCCWGEVATPGSLGFSYGPGTPPYLMQQVRGLLPAGAEHSLPVVPTQLYHLLLCLGVGVLLHALRRATWPGGSRYLLAMGLLCLGRGLIECWRDPAGEPLLATPLVVAGVSLWRVQWLVLFEALALLGSWGWLIRRGGRSVPAETVAPGRPGWIALGLLLATGWLGGSLLTEPELLTLRILLLLVLLAEGRALLPHLYYGLPRLAGLPLATLLAGVILLATAQAPAPQREKSSEPTKIYTVSGGLLGNYHEAQENILETNWGCSSKQPLLLQQRVRAAGAELAVTTPATGFFDYDTWGGGVWVGEQRIAAHPFPTNSYRFVPTDTTLRYTLTDVHLYREVQHNRGWLSTGVRVGLHVGSLGYYSYFDNGNSRHTTWLMPELMVRLGNPRLLYGQADLCYGAENALGAYTARVSLGSGLGRIGGSQVLAGYAHSPHRDGPGLAFVSATIRPPSSTGLSALSIEPYFATNFDQHQQFSLKLNYRLGH